MIGPRLWHLHACGDRSLRRAITGKQFPWIGRPRSVVGIGSVGIEGAVGAQAIERAGNIMPKGVRRLWIKIDIGAQGLNLPLRTHGVSHQIPVLVENNLTFRRTVVGLGGLFVLTQSQRLDLLLPELPTPCEQLRLPVGLFPGDGTELPPAPGRVFRYG